ncbi:MAG: transcriptional regulator TrmB [Candidatus Taylorbacteria bacterium]|nr:transcriptional regulator TrmB [Candidatus Taylorbacteria bacterium]
MEIDLKNELKHLGFSDTESAVYLALLELGSATNSKIAQKSGLNRITAFEVLKRLSQKGIVSGFKMKGVMYFGALNPQILIKQQRESLGLLEKGLTELIQNKADYKRPKITTYSTKEGLKQIYEETLLSNTEILTFINSKDLRDYFGNDYIENYVKQRVKKGIKIRGFWPDDEVGRRDKNEEGDALREVRFLPKGQSVQNEVMIFDDKVVMLSTKDEMGIVIKNQSIAESLRTVWEMLWEKSQ